jgi:hypothetical protein
MSNVTFTPEQSLTYLANNADVLTDANARARAAGIPPGPQFQNFVNQVAQEHFNLYGKTEGRQGVPEGAVELAQQQDFNTANQQAVQTFNQTQADNRAQFNQNQVDLTPITNLIGTDAGPGGEGDRTTLMGRQKVMQDFLRSGQQDIEGIVRPLGEQVTGLETSIGTAARGQAPTLMGQTEDLATGQTNIQQRIGEAATDPTTGLPAQPTSLFKGQRGLIAGQQGLGRGQMNIQQQIGTAGGTSPLTGMDGEPITVAPTGLYAGQAELATGQEGLQTGQEGLQTGQEQLGTQIGALGTAAVTDPDTGEVTQKPTGLFAGQAGLMAGQTGLTQDISGLGRELSDVSADIGGQLTGLGGQLGAFRSGVEQYQRGATTQRGDIQGTQRAGQANLLAQIQGVGQQANRAAEAIAQQRQMQTQTQQPAVQQQAAQFARSAPRATPSNQQVGPMGPMSQDPRDVLIQNLLRNASLMNRRPV